MLQIRDTKFGRAPCEFHLCDSTSAVWENSELIFLYLELVVLIFVLKDCYLRTLLGSDKNF